MKKLGTQSKAVAKKSVLRLPQKTRPLQPKKLDAKKLSALVDKLAATGDRNKGDVIQTRILEGFYGKTTEQLGL